MECGMAFVRRRKRNPPMITPLLFISLASFFSAKKELMLLILPVLSRIPLDFDDPFYTNLVDDSTNMVFRILRRVDFLNDVLMAVFVPVLVISSQSKRYSPKITSFGGPADRYLLCRRLTLSSRDSS